jgi:hypothetical protein
VNTVSHAEKASESSLPTPVLTKLRPDTASKRHGVCSFFALPAFNKGPQRLRNQAVAELRGTSRVWIRTWRQERALPSGWGTCRTVPSYLGQRSLVRFCKDSSIRTSHLSPRRNDFARILPVKLFNLMDQLGSDSLK